MSKLNWHGSKEDLEWYQLYKNNPVKVKVKNISGIGGQPSGTFIVRDFKKSSSTSPEAEFTINYQGRDLSNDENLDNPKTYLDKKYDRKYAFKFYSGSMPITARQAFNLIQTKKAKCKQD